MAALISQCPIDPVLLTRLREFERCLLCPICQDRVSNPQRLPCSHSLCGGCLGQMADYEKSQDMETAEAREKMKRRAGEMFCPVCRAVVSKRASHPDELLSAVTRQFDALRVTLEAEYGGAIDPSPSLLTHHIPSPTASPVKDMNSVFYHHHRHDSSDSSSSSSSSSSTANPARKRRQRASAPVISSISYHRNHDSNGMEEKKSVLHTSTESIGQENYDPQQKPDELEFDGNDASPDNHASTSTGARRGRPTKRARATTPTPNRLQTPARPATKSSLFSASRPSTSISAPPPSSTPPSSTPPSSTSLASLSTPSSSLGFSSTRTPTRASSRPHYYWLHTKLDASQIELVNELITIVNDRGDSVVELVENFDARTPVTHLLTPATQSAPIVTARTSKYFRCVLANISIVTIDWVVECLQHQDIIDATPFTIKGDTKFQHGVERRKTFDTSHRLFASTVFRSIGTFNNPATMRGLMDLIICGGGEWRSDQPFTAADIANSHYQRFVLFDDTKPTIAQSNQSLLTSSMMDTVANSEHATIVSAGWVFDSISGYQFRPTDKTVNT